MRLAVVRSLTTTSTLVAHRAGLALTTIPADVGVWRDVAQITAATTVVAAVTAVATGFVDPIHDFDLSPVRKHWWKPISAILFPSLVEEVFWRGMCLPHPSATASMPLLSSLLTPRVGLVLALHVLSHPIAGRTVWPRGGRGNDVFCDPRFLLVAAVVLGGSTVSYLASGGSAWAAALTHAVPVALWRDCFGGEARLSAAAAAAAAASSGSPREDPPSKID